MTGLRTQGFTLLELLVALVVMGLLAVAVVLNINQAGSERQLQTEAERLRELLTIALDEAALRSRDLGLYVTETGYAFMQRVPDPQTRKPVWQMLANEPVLRARELEGGLTLSIEVEDEDLPLFSNQTEQAAREERKQRDKEPVPQLYILSSGELTPFLLTLKGESYRAQLKVDADGRLLVSGPQLDSERAEFVDPDVAPVTP